MFKETMFVLSVIIGLFPACDSDDSKPPGGGQFPQDGGEGEGEGSHGEGEGEGVAGEGEGEGEGEADCVNLQNNPEHCGVCGNMCGENEQCIEGQCSVCPDARERWCPKRWEGFECINVQNHPANCGECGVWCNDFGYECVNGECACKRDADHCESAGADICTDLKRDWNNCGRCGDQCTRGSECYSGRCGDCVQSWDIEQCNGNCIVCDGACVITVTDEMNCGRCGNRCAVDGSEQCVEGLCVPRN